jgi:hypothetical protein
LETPKITSLAFGERVGYIKPNANERRFGLEIDWWSTTALTL